MELSCDGNELDAGPFVRPGFDAEALVRPLVVRPAPCPAVFVRNADPEEGESPEFGAELRVGSVAVDAGREVFALFGAAGVSDARRCVAASPSPGRDFGCGAVPADFAASAVSGRPRSRPVGKIRL